MTKSHTFYFSTGSRYSYLAMSQLPRIEQRYGVTFDWVPVNGKRIRSLRGADPFLGPPLSGQYDWDYRERDAKAWADFYGVVYNEPEQIDFDVECLLRGIIAAAKQTDIRPYAWALAQAVFALQADLRSIEVTQQLVERIARECGLNVPRLVEDCHHPNTQLQLEENCREAVARGAFGTPTVFVGEEMFWGNDRLGLLEFRLSAAHAEDKPIAVVRLDHVVLKSPAPERLADFYCKAFGTRVERQIEDFLWQLRIGESLLDILRADSGVKGAEGMGGGEGPDSLKQSNMDHFAVTVNRFDPQRIAAHLKDLDVESEYVERIYGAEGYGPSVYFYDPDGNRVELKIARRR
ncbi:MAG: DsbA family protein [Pseudomonadota bacterium]